jgi:hypothetical protein
MTAVAIAASGAPEPLDRGDRVFLERVDDVLGADFERRLQARGIGVDRDDRGARDARVLDRQVAEAAGAEHRDKAGRGGLRDLDGLVRRHACARQRRRIRRADAVGDPHDVACIADRVLGE